MQETKLVPAPKARRDYFGGITAMTEWRWRKDGILPEPIKINNRCFYREADLLAAPVRAAEVQRVKDERKANGEAA